MLSLFGASVKPAKPRRCYICNEPAQKATGMVGAMRADEFCAWCARQAVHELALDGLPPAEKIKRRLARLRKE